MACSSYCQARPQDDLCDCGRWY